MRAPKGKYPTGEKDIINSSPMCIGVLHTLTAKSQTISKLQKIFNCTFPDESFFIIKKITLLNYMTEFPLYKEVIILVGNVTFVSWF